MQKEKATLRNQLSLIEAIALSIGIMAPTAAMALNGSLAAATTGSAVPLAFLLATITVGLASFSFIYFSRYFAHSGSVYAFNGVALGARVGFFSGWALLGTYIAFTCASMAEVGNFAQAFLADLNISVDWLPLALVAGIIIWVCAYCVITLSTRLTLILEGISVLLIVIVAVVILSRGGASGHLSVEPFIPSGQPLSNIGLAAVFGFLSFAGFEGAATLGEETRNPRRNIPLAILTAALGTGIFYVAVTYAQTVGFGTDAAGINAFATSTAPLGDLSKRYMGNPMSTAINFGATISAFASALGTANAAARILFAMGRDGFISKRIGTTSSRTSSPAIAVGIVMIIAFIVDLLWSRVPDINGASLFGYAGTIGVFLILVTYILTNIGAIRFFVTRRIWTWHCIIPVLAIVALGYTLYSNLYPIPAPPSNYFPYVALAWLVIGLVFIFANPALVKRIGLSFEKSEGLSLENSDTKVSSVKSEEAATTETSVDDKESEDEKKVVVTTSKAIPSTKKIVTNTKNGSSSAQRNRNKQKSRKKQRNRR
ncbi:APC family permease [Ktedonospora formicarum]|uniref:Amino acid permease n=1 Tax=Ktedonospora formicarum TaxID=2778364 RepID=A0A8J3MX04_9CHLR|nr:APC family permease [Ktedonospora formicarum]GHO50920.1 amino acid permease [Ktedonospora formicarum]